MSGRSPIHNLVNIVKISVFLGLIVDIDAMAIARVCGAMGAARAMASDLIQSEVGLQLLVSVGQQITLGDTWALLHHGSPLCSDLQNKLQRAMVIDNNPAAAKGKISRTLEIIH